MRHCVSLCVTVRHCASLCVTVCLGVSLFLAKRERSRESSLTRALANEGLVETLTALDYED